MADPLAAASLVMAIIAMLYGAWSAEISQAAALTLDPLRADRVANKAPQLWGAFVPKAVPLGLGALSALTIFFWRAAAIVGTLWRHPKGAVFDDVGAAFVVTVGFTLLLALSLGWQIFKLIGQLFACYAQDTPGA
jgi:hypothetical protein